MKADNIYKALRAKFRDNKYVLENSYIFNWECDFFYQTSTGYYVEIEVKVSRSDFKADFKKEKHLHFNRVMNGVKHYVTRTHQAFKVVYEELVSKVDEKGVRCLDDSGNIIRVPSGKKLMTVIECLEQNIEKSFSSTTRRLISYEPFSSGIYIHKTPKTPHKFYFACPSGLILPEEVPKYAGLLWVEEDGNIKVKKNAKFLHKENTDLKQVLLDKFFWLSRSLSDKLSMIERRFNEV